MPALSAPPRPATSADRATNAGPLRQYELDWLRLASVLAVVVMHVAQTYARPTDPAARWSAQSETLGSFLALTGYWRMPLLFCIAGMVATHTRGRRGLGEYVRARAERLLLPLAAGLALLGPAQYALEAVLVGAPGLHFAWGYFWFLGALAGVTVLTLPLGAWLARPGVRRTLAPLAEHGGTLVVLGALPIAATLLPYRLLGTAPVLGHVDLKTLIGYGGDFVAGMVLGSAPAFRATVIGRRRAALLAWAGAAALQVVGTRAGWDAHVAVVAEGVASWAWVLACYGFAAHHLATPSPVLMRWASRALAIYILHGVPLAVARNIVLPPELPLPLQVVLLVAITAVMGLALVRLAEGFAGTARLLGMRHAPISPEPVSVHLAHAVRQLAVVIRPSAAPHVELGGIS